MGIIDTIMHIYGLDNPNVQQGIRTDLSNAENEIGQTPLVGMFKFIERNYIAIAAILILLWALFNLHWIL